MEVVCMMMMFVGISWFFVNVVWYDDSFCGFMFDVSCDCVLMCFIFDFLMCVMVWCGFNYFEFYGEVGFVYCGEEEVWVDCSFVMVEDMRWFDGLCCGWGIEFGVN